MDSVPEYTEDAKRIRNNEIAFIPPQTEWRKDYNSKRRGHTLDARNRNQKFLSNSALKDQAEIKYPAIDGSRYDPRRANNTVQAISYRNSNMNKPGYLAAHTVREIEKRDHRKMRARLPAYQIFSSQEIPIENSQMIKQGVSFAKDSVYVAQHASVATKINSSEE